MGSDQPGFHIEYSDIDDLSVENLLDLVADELVHPLHVDLLGKTALNTVDHRQLCGALVGLDEPFRLGDGPRATERRRDVLADERQQVDILLRVNLADLVRLDDEGADRLPSALSGTPTQSHQAARPTRPRR